MIIYLLLVAAALDHSPMSSTDKKDDQPALEQLLDERLSLSEEGHLPVTRVERSLGSPLIDQFSVVETFCNSSN